MSDSPVQLRPIHNIDGTVRSMARQMLADIDKEAPNTTLPTAQLVLLLETLDAALDRPLAPPQPAVRGMLNDATIAQPVAPRYWRPRADLAEDE